MAQNRKRLASGFFIDIKRSQPASDHKSIECFLPITRRSPHIKECQFIPDFLSHRFVSPDPRILRRGFIHAG